MTYAISIAEPLAYATVDDLRSQVEAELDRDDITDDDWRSTLQLVETYLNRTLRHPQMEKVTGIAVTDGAGTLPADFLAMRALYDANKVSLPSVDAVSMIETPVGGRKVCSIVGEQLLVAPQSTETVTLIYYGKIPRLTINEQSNWVLANHADVYFFGCLMYLSSRIGDNDSGAVEKWRTAFGQSVGELEEFGKRRRFGGPLLQRSNVRQVRGALC